MFASEIANVGTWLLTGASITKQFADQVRIRLIKLLINGISRVLQKLVEYFNGALILTSFMLSFPVLSPVLF